MPGTNLTDARIGALKPRKSADDSRDVRGWFASPHATPVVADRSMPVLSVIMREDAGGRSRRVSLGPISTMTVEEARLRYHERRASPDTEGFAAPAPTVPLFRELVEGAWNEAHFERCKPATRKSYASLLETRLLPAFGSQPLDRIAPAQARRWFDRFSRTAPGNANNALKLLRQILDFAIARGHLDTNPARDIEDARLHDLRHTHASHAVMNGVPVPVVSRMLGHASTWTTLRYAHLGDRDIEQTAERVGQAVAAAMDI